MTVAGPLWARADELAMDVAWASREYVVELTRSRQRKGARNGALRQFRQTNLAESEGRMRGKIFAWREATQEAIAEMRRTDAILAAGAQS